jgi:hypothetical protein
VWHNTETPTKETNGQAASSRQVEFRGPMETHAVYVNGWRVPYLEAIREGGTWHLMLERRHHLSALTEQEAERFLPFLADCIAVAAGWSDWPSPYVGRPKRRRPFTRV